VGHPKTWYEYHATKFEADTAHLSCEQVGAYQRLLNFHFLNGHIPGDIDQLTRILRESKQKTRKLWVTLKPFFYEENGCFFQKRMVDTIAKAVDISEKRKEAGRKGGEANAIANAKANGEAKGKTVTVTVTDKDKKKESKEKTARRSRLPADWIPSEKLIDYCRDKRPDLNPETTFENFKDYYISHGKVMADWDLTAMRWVRNEKAQPGTYRQATRETDLQRAERKIREADARDRLA
jgi:uncharacterized protein YdaU (DUF1376 family)